MHSYLHRIQIAFLFLPQSRFARFDSNVGSLAKCLCEDRGCRHDGRRPRCTLNIRNSQTFLHPQKPANQIRRNMQKLTYLFYTDLWNSHAWKAPSFHTTEGSPSICTGTKPKIGIDFWGCGHRGTSGEPHSDALDLKVPKEWQKVLRGSTAVQAVLRPHWKKALLRFGIFRYKLSDTVLPSQRQEIWNENEESHTRLGFICAAHSNPNQLAIMINNLTWKSLKFRVIYIKLLKLN